MVYAIIGQKDDAITMAIAMMYIYNYFNKYIYHIGTWSLRVMLIRTLGSSPSASSTARVRVALVGPIRLGIVVAGVATNATATTLRVTPVLVA